MGSPEPEKKTNSEDIAGLKNANATFAFVKPYLILKEVSYERQNLE
jgi:hypothetical protein